MIIFFSFFCFNNSFAKVQSSNLSAYFDGCMIGAKQRGEYAEGIKTCTCVVERMNEKLSNREFEKLFIYERWTANAWLQENVMPYCN